MTAAAPWCPLCTIVGVATPQLAVAQWLASCLVNVPLRATAFRGDPDVGELHGFFDPAFQFDGDTRWTFGTSLKSAYVNTFEFMNEPPLVQLWRDDAGALQAVSRILLGTGVWFHLAAPAYRTHETAQTITAQADAAFRLLTDRASWETVRYCLLYTSDAADE